MDSPVRLTVVGDEGAAEALCGLLRSDGIRCFHRTTDLTPEIPGPGAWREILVLGDDLARARELLEAAEPAADECVRCGRAIGAEGGWYVDEEGELQPYCGVCAERVFGPA